MLLQCCALNGISGFPYDHQEETNEYIKSRWTRLKLEISMPGNYMATVSRNQLKAKRILEKSGFQVIGRLRSRDDGRTIYVMAKGITPVSTPRTKRGKHARRK